MDVSRLITGRPYGGCAILFRKWLSPYITRHAITIKRFCGLTINSNTSKVLLICVYLPSNYNTSQSNDLYLETLGELNGFVNSLTFDKIIIAGGFDVDFSRSNMFKNYLDSFMSVLNLVAVDTQREFDINFTYRRDDDLVHSWPDHILTLSSSL